METIPKAPNLLFLDGGGEMGDIIRTMDWNKSSLGNIETWQTSLRTTLGIILHSSSPMFLFWGEELICFYNDACGQYRDKAEKYHDIGKNGKEIWPGVWDMIGSSILRVFNTAQPISFYDGPVPYTRNGKLDGIFWSYSCSAVYDDNGKKNGVLVICTERGNIQKRVGSSSDMWKQKIFREELEKQIKRRTKELVALNEDLKKREQRYHQMIEEVQDYAILYINRDGIIQNWNKGAEKIKGYKAEEIIGKSFLNFYTEKDRENGLPTKLLNQAAQHNRAVQKGWRVKKDNTLFWASVVITAIHNEKNEVIGFSKVTHDLTAKKATDDALKNKQLELEQKNIELQEMNKELQSFTFISSHDLQEPLRKIQTFALRIAEKEKDNLSENGKYLFKRMQLSAERMQVLIDDLLAYSRTHNMEGDFKITDLNGLIEQVKQDLNEELIQNDVTIDMSDTCQVNIIPFQFRQLIYNLLSNSIKFSNPGKPVHIKIINELLKGGDLKGMGLQNDKIYCHITFSDNGIGFDQQYSDKIFELFQRLHGRTEYPGTGMGLAIIKKIIENHKGAIRAESKLGEGASFHIYIPTEGK